MKDTNIRIYANDTCLPAGRRMDTNYVECDSFILIPDH